MFGVGNASAHILGNGRTGGSITLRPAPGSHPAFWDFISSNGTSFVLVRYDASATQSTAYSSDGLNYTVTTNLPSNIWSGLGTNGSIYVTVAFEANSSPASAISTDNGVTWTNHSVVLPATRDYFNPIYYNGTNFLIVGFDTITINTVYYLTSPDGITWTESNYATPTHLPTDIASNGTDFVSLIPNGTNTSVNWVSSDGNTWTAYTDSVIASKEVWFIQSNGTTYLAMGCNSSDSFFTAATSTNGITWTNVGVTPVPSYVFTSPSPARITPRPIVSNGDLFLMLYNKVFYTTHNGISWTTTPFTDTLNEEWQATSKGLNYTTCPNPFAATGFINQQVASITV